MDDEQAIKDIQRAEQVFTDLVLTYPNGVLVSLKSLFAKSYDFDMSRQWMRMSPAERADFTLKRYKHLLADSACEFSQDQLREIGFDLRDNEPIVQGTITVENNSATVNLNLE